MDSCCFDYVWWNQFLGQGQDVVTPVAADNLWSKYYVFSGLPSPLPNTTYRVGQDYLNGLRTNDSFTTMKSATSEILVITAASADISPQTSGSSGEGVLLSINNITQGQECPLGTIFFDATYGSYIFTGLSCVINPDDEWDIIYSTPNWSVNPVDVAMTFSLLFEIQS